MKTSTTKSIYAVALLLTFINPSPSMASDCIVSGETKLATIEFGGEAHAYYFRSEAGQRAVIEMADISNGMVLEPRIQLIDPDGVQIDDSGWQWERAEIDKKLEKTGIHTIVVSDGYGDVDFGEYTLSLIVTGDTITCPQDRDGKDLTNGFAVNGTITLGDLDTSIFYGQVGQGVWIECVDLSVEKVLEPRVRLYDPNGELVADSGWQWERATIENHQLAMRGIYTVIASDGYADVDAGDFGLSVAVMPPKNPHGRYPYGPQPADGRLIDYRGPNYQFGDVVVENRILPDGTIVTRHSGAYLLGWWSVIGATGYDVYFAFGPCMPLEKLAENVTEPWVEMPALDENQVYYWRVVAHTPAGDIQGPTWWFSVKPYPYSLSISKIGQGTIVDSNVGFQEYSYGEVVSVTAVADPGFEFVRWEGTAVDAIRVIPDPTDPTKVSVTVDGAYTLKAVFEEVLFEFPLDGDPEWTAEGQWEFGMPMGQGGEDYGNPDPTGGYTGANVFGVNLSSDYDVNVGPLYSLVAGPFDLSGYSQVNLRFARWLNTDEPGYVTASVEVSTDNKNWRHVWESETAITDSQWVRVKYPLDNEADGEAAVYLRWTYQVVGERAYPCSGWNLDDIQLCGKRQ